jgi:hypothetical protein
MVIQEVLHNDAKNSDMCHYASKILEPDPAVNAHDSPAQGPV